MERGNLQIYLSNKGHSPKEVNYGLVSRTAKAILMGSQKCPLKGGTIALVPIPK